MQQYQQHKQQYNTLKDKLDFLKTRSQLSQQLPSSPSQQQKQKKKPRPLEQGLLMCAKKMMGNEFHNFSTLLVIFREYIIYFNFQMTLYP